MHGMQEVRSSILLISTIMNVITTQFANCVVIFICTMKGGGIYGVSTEEISLGLPSVEEGLFV